MILASKPTRFSSSSIFRGLGTLMTFLGADSSRVNQSENSDLFAKSLRSPSLIVRAAIVSTTSSQFLGCISYLLVQPNHWLLHGLVYRPSISPPSRLAIASSAWAHLIRRLRYVCRIPRSPLLDVELRYGHYRSVNLLSALEVPSYSFVTLCLSSSSPYFD